MKWLPGQCADLVSGGGVQRSVRLIWRRLDRQRGTRWLVRHPRSWHEKWVPETRLQPVGGQQQS
jgi:hypothetical protein